MDILNAKGRFLFDNRKEFKRHYSPSVDEALKQSIYELYTKKQINEKTFRIIFDEDRDDLEVYSYLLSQKEFTKSQSELTVEFDKVRNTVDEYLASIGLVDNISTKNILNRNKIAIIHQYDFPQHLLLKYFGLSQSEIIPLMKRKGFMDKFCVLRLDKIFQEIYAKMKIPEHIDHGYSLVYYNSEIKGFSVDYKYYLNINYISNPDNMVKCLNKIKDLDRVVTRKFQSKIGHLYFDDKNTPAIENKEKPKLIEKPKAMPELNPFDEEAKKEETDEKDKKSIVETMKETAKDKEFVKRTEETPEDFGVVDSEIEDKREEIDDITIDIPDIPKEEIPKTEENTQDNTYDDSSQEDDFDLNNVPLDDIEIPDEINIDDIDDSDLL